MNKNSRRSFHWLWRIGKALLGFVVLTAVATTIIIHNSGDKNYRYTLNTNVVNDITGLNPIHVGKVVAPKSLEEIVYAIQSSTGPISIGGGRYSQGGQIAYQDSLHIDMREFDKVVRLDTDAKEITVQPGITWREIQEVIDPHDLSVRIMQTYANFTVGGSLSVNVHGRYIGEGPLVNSVKSIKLVLADGSLVEASLDENSELFYGAIGGYGGLGVIVEARLALADNSRIMREVSLMPIDDYLQHFDNDIRNNPNIVFHNGDIYPPDYRKVRDVSWYKTTKPLTIDDRLIAADTEYGWQPRTAEFVAGSAFGKWLREYVIDPIYYSFDRIVWRNWEASYDVRELEPKSRSENTYVLREYFIPVRNFDSFVVKMRDIFQSHEANIINVSIRHAHKDPGTLLAWAREEVFAFVVYYQQGTDDASREKVKAWSLKMIDAAISEEGSYYLPYQIFESEQQFQAAYPRAQEFFQLKQRIDPDYRFRNALWKRLYPAELALEKTAETIDNNHAIANYHRGEEQTFLTIPEWYLVFNPQEYAEYLEAGKNPSDFPFMASINEYWKLYDRVRAISGGSYPENSAYMLMLKVIGISTTIEYMFKSLYENTVGRLTRWSASGEDTQEDVIIQQAQRAYSELIFDKAWYEFDYSGWIKRMWSETDFIGHNFLRKLERKLSFTFEYGFKALYAKLIGFGSKATFEQSDGLIYMTVTGPSEAFENLPKSVNLIDSHGDVRVLSVTRWGEFTKAIPLLAEKGVKFKDISGNDYITVSMVAPTVADEKFKYAEPLFDSDLVSDEKQKRLVVLTKVKNLSEALAEVNDRGFRLEHIYDY